MKAIAINTYILMMFLSYVLPRAGTFSMEEKVNMIEFLGYMALTPNRVVNPSIANLPFLSSASGVSLNHSKKVEHGDEEIRLEEEMRYRPSRDDHLRAQSQASKNPEHTPRH